GLADLLSITLDGTPGLRVVDPSGVWESLEADADGAPMPPAPEEAGELSRRAAAARFVTGDILQSGSRLEISARVHRA
ncbi:MAG: hypothetical protein GWM92_07360, partial [Gemmatimonadetes bacterium]|nr:hypothetical protein [Gemmatimonadota bacterium]NIR78444.1 hypothetical protein [Gemmatimonadota bacterium]NIT87054.1 hypothetical protein [Gemmatimonadota bacterium]NIU30893.1 hypothetical protein [Gemmatimonadota bacterium]NIU35656.1 hypothetical protein [Gemmatimonadota bacterium]